MDATPKNPKISVIVPFFNQGEFLVETLESVFSQTFKDFEIIVIDDGSTDAEALRVLDEVEKKYPEIEIIHQKNGGPANARNSGIKVSRGEFFLPLDADDTIEPTMLEKCFNVISKDPKLGFVYTHTHFFGNEDSVWKNPQYNFFELLWANSATVSGIVRKKAWEEAGGYDEDEKNKYEDWEFWINLGKHGWHGKVLKDQLFNYRRHGASRLGASELGHDAAVRYIRQKHGDLYSKESLAKTKKAWKPQGGKHFENFGAKMKGTGIASAELWKKHPIAALGRLIPIRFKRKINALFGKKVFDTSYYHRSGE